MCHLKALCHWCTVRWRIQMKKTQLNLWQSLTLLGYCNFLRIENFLSTWKMENPKTQQLRKIYTLKYSLKLERSTGPSQYYINSNNFGCEENLIHELSLGMCKSWNNQNSVTVKTSFPLPTPRESHLDKHREKFCQKFSRSMGFFNFRWCLWGWSWNCILALSVHSYWEMQNN